MQRVMLHPDDDILITAGSRAGEGQGEEEAAKVS